MVGILVIGYGNPIRGDDGIGWYAAETLRERFGDDISILTRLQLTPDLAEPISRSTFCLFLDADQNGNPGSLHSEEVTPQDGLGETVGALSHHVTPPMLLYMAQALYGTCPRAAQLTMTGADFDRINELSPVIQSAMPELIDIATSLICGYEAVREGEKGDDDARIFDC